MMLKRRTVVDIRASLPPNLCPGRFGTKNSFLLNYLTHITATILIMIYDKRKASGEERLRQTADKVGIA